MAAGNGITVKPSEHAPAAAELIRSMMAESFSTDDVAVVLGDAETSKELIDPGFDKVFFTGSPDVGSMVAQRAAARHSDVTLELGGKSPVIVAPDSDIDFVARRIIWGKFINAGQTCIAPDYLAVHTDIADRLVSRMNEVLLQFFGDDPFQSPDYGRIVNEFHFERLVKLMDGTSPITGGGSRKESLYIEPTVVEAPSGHPIWKEEVFGPILPYRTWSEFENLERIINENPNPLAAYIFTRNRRLAQRIIGRIPFGGGMVNDTILHVADHRLPFGGRGRSGTGRYHGQWGFDSFSHNKALRFASQRRSGSMRFPPYRPIPETVRKWIFGI
jgi:aldehyde dehydrogenase (NAD+)